MSEHVTVLLKEAVEALVSDSAGFYIDGTFGRGGHSQAILGVLGEGGRLLAIDKDPAAIAAGQTLQAADGRLLLYRGSFAELDHALADHGVTAADGILLDLGVSSPQLDDAERGFSFSRDGDLDMRMNPDAGQSAAQWLAGVEKAELVRVLKEYGEERFAKRIAGAIVAAREEHPITRTLQLAKIVTEANPAWEKHKHPATRAFQAIRIAVNDELRDLEVALSKAVDCLAPGGRLVVISFHSLEDRMVKQFMRRESRGDEPPSYIPVQDSAISNRRLKLLGKAIKPGADELAQNPRARSAVMRVAEKR
ncbi:16S rRNA (cytosine(1402)-N(4))-methyltransferase RsmH [Litorivivens sp.]|uniref:16S rRNA (cytosine(1402)-N(4))-methyltransferase RsmH n=1 Tax=Litorivivens sp. TaxID=2020868 RepID=UPI00356398EC